MKKNALFSFNCFWQKLILLLLIIFLKSINSAMLPNMKIYYLSQNKYMIITVNTVYHYTSSSGSLETFFSFVGNQIITSDSESEMISFGQFDNISHLLIFKNSVYAVFGGIFCNIENDKINNYKSEIFPLKIINDYYYYIIGVINSEKKLILYLYKNRAGECNSILINNFSINNINSENFSCQLMQSSVYGELLTCFYEINGNIIIANGLTVNYNIDNNNIASSFSVQKTNNGAKIIKTQLSHDGTKIYVCYINTNNNCDCLTYLIATNEWTDYTTYINSCLPNVNTLFFDYYEVSNEYFLYCYETNSKINIFKLDDNLGIINKYSNDTFDFIQSCSQYYLSSLIYNSNDIKIFTMCGENLNYLLVGKFPEITTTILTTLLYTTTLTTIPATTILTTIPATTIITTIPVTTILTTIPATTIITTFPETTMLTNIPVTTILTTIPITTILTTIPVTTIISTTPETTIPAIISSTDNFEEQNKIIIYQKTINKTKEEIINNLDNAMLEYEINKIYEIFGDDYNIKISPINTNIYNNISTYIDFSNCENILRDKNELSQSSVLTVYQIEIENSNDQSLINEVEYAVFDEDKNRLDLSVCKEEIIQINYQLDTTMINMTTINYYSELGIDVFNIEDLFFNDITLFMGVNYCTNN